MAVWPPHLAKGEELQPTCEGDGKGRRGKQYVLYFLQGSVILTICLVSVLAPQWWHRNVLFTDEESPPPVAANATRPPPWDNWEAIVPSAKLEWHSCYDGLDCSRFSVPLDWLDPSDERRVVLAVVRKNATDRTNYLGPLFLNPGGPGASGVNMVRYGGAHRQAIVGSNFDIVSFDPRGMGATTPAAHCWSGPQAERIWSMGKGDSLVDTHPGMLYDLYAWRSLQNAQCESSIGDLTRFAGTASAARDMLAILEEMGQKRLNYWGFSYGTVIGSTFAAMFPDKVDRMVNDGNVDLVEWYNVTEIRFVDSTDEAMRGFFSLCHAAGREKCAFWSPSPAAIQSRLESLYSKLRTNPVRVFPTTFDIAHTSQAEILRPDLITYSDAKAVVVLSLYQPVTLWNPLAHALHELEAGKGSTFIEYASIFGYRSPDFSCSCSADPDSNSKNDACLPSYPLKAVGNNDGWSLVKCGEGPLDPETDSLPAIFNYYKRLKQKAPLSSAVMFNSRIPCAGWKSRHKWRFEGPWHVQPHHPILFIGNTFDNVTPLSSAIRNAAYFTNSSVLVQDSYGHCSTTTPSLCTARVVRRYFQTGELPENGTVCQADSQPFGVRSEQILGEIDEGIRWEIEDERVMRDVLEQLSKMEVTRLF